VFDVSPVSVARAGSSAVPEPASTADVRIPYEDEVPYSNW
jgi:hypothetical protein